MAKQTEIAYEPTKEWADYQTGGTRIDAADLNNMEGGIADACAAVDQLRTKRLPTYLVAQDGDTATQDVYQEAILGPCLIVDLATATTYYDNGEDGEGHERTKLTSGADIDDLRDSLSHAAGLVGPTYVTDSISFTITNKPAIVFVQKVDYERFLVGYYADGAFHEWLRGSDGVSFTAVTSVSVSGNSVTLHNDELTYSTWHAIMLE